MSNVVLDSSAVLALLQNEPGAEHVRAVLPGAILSLVNFAEILTKLVERGMPVSDARTSILGMGIELAEFDVEQACRVASLRPLTRSAGLSLGDRACLALAEHRHATAMTADLAWHRLSIAALPPIFCIRGGTD